MIFEASFKRVDISDLEVDRLDTKLSTLKPLHAKSITRSFHYFNSDGRSIMINGWRAAGITAAVARCRNDNWQAILDPFARLINDLDVVFLFFSTEIFVFYSLTAN